MRLRRMPPAAGDHLWVELLLLWVEEVFDENLAFFDVIDQAPIPTVSHAQLAAAAVRGAPVLVTTNRRIPA